MGTEKMFLLMLSRFEEITLDPIMKGLAECLDNKEGDEAQNACSFKFKAHQLKGAASYMGAGVVYYASNQVQVLYQQNQFKDMYEYYPTIVEAALSVLFQIDRIMPNTKES